MTYDAIIFDLDGTLLDTLADIAESVNVVLAQFGFPVHELDAYRNFVGDGVATLFDRAIPEDRCDAQTVQACVAAFREAYRRRWNVHTCPYDGIPEMLDELSRRRWRLAVLSNKPDEFTQSCVRHFLSTWRFEVVFGQREGIPRKPDPTAANEIAALLNVPSSRCLYVGDTSIDMHTACNAGMYPVGVLWGFRTRRELELAGARHLIDHPRQLLDLLPDPA
jgi:phosphoglycolate phosphatase